VTDQAERSNRVSKASVRWRSAQGKLDELVRQASTCRNCELWERATHVVFGEGAPVAKVVLIGEQPGDEEDLQARPFVGPAGRVLRAGLETAGLRKQDVYVTNAVKHFNWEPRGKRRIHSRPRLSHLLACHPWLDAEIAAVKPRVLVCLGAVAARSVFGRPIRVTREHGRALPTPYGVAAVVTIHPAAILRARDPQSRAALLAQLVDQLKLACRIAGS
jgi:DNA polymerase